MFQKNTSVITTAALLIGLVGCGGGSSDPESNNNSEMDSNAGNTDEGSNSEVVLTGIFVDSAVEGVSYATATQSGTTNSTGEFSYIAGEQVTFSIGATQLPAVTAAAQVSPVDMAQGSTNPADTSTNIARLLQSLDTDSDPDNGITISAEAAANVAVINFSVSVEEFSNNTDVINLVANSGSTTTQLISAEDANAHLNDTLGIANAASIDGLWIRNSAVNSGTGLEDYSFVDGLNFSRYNSTGEGCYTLSTNTAVSLENDRFQLNGSDSPVFFSAVRVGDTLEVTFDGSDTLIYPSAAGIDRNSLPICSDNDGSGSNVALATFAGFYDSTMNSDFQHYLLINTEGLAIEYEDREENVESCFHTETWTFVSLGGDQFRLERAGRDAQEFSLSFQDNGLLLDGAPGSVLFPQVTTLTQADLPLCS